MKDESLMLAEQSRHLTKVTLLLLEFSSSALRRNFKCAGLPSAARANKCARSRVRVYRSVCLAALAQKLRSGSYTLIKQGINHRKRRGAARAIVRLRCPEGSRPSSTSIYLPSPATSAIVSIHLSALRLLVGLGPTATGAAGAEEAMNN